MLLDSHSHSLSLPPFSLPLPPFSLSLSFPPPPTCDQGLRIHYIEVNLISVGAVDGRRESVSRLVDSICYG